MNYNPIYQALADQLQALVGSQLKSPVTRRWFELEDIGSDQQPAISVVGMGGREERKSPAEKPRHWLRAMIIIYARDQEETATTTPETQLYALKAAVDDALKFQTPADGPASAGGAFTAARDGNSTTLGGRVYHTRVIDHVVHHGVDAGQVALTMVVELLAID